MASWPNLTSKKERRKKKCDETEKKKPSKSKFIQRKANNGTVMGS
jgi:hypothetical protein